MEAVNQGFLSAGRDNNPPCVMNRVGLPLISIASTSSSAHGLEMAQEQNDVSRVLQVLGEHDMVVTWS